MGTAEEPGKAMDFDALVGFLDLSGFTAASERLGNYGARGTEQVRDLINTLFSPVIEAIHGAGGEIGWFAGDAVGIIFDRSHTADQVAVDAMLWAARHLGEQDAYETLDGRVRLAAKLGIATGPMRWNRVQRIQTISWFAGDAINSAVEAEAHAEPSTIVVTEDLAELASIAAAPVGSGFVRLDSSAATGALTDSPTGTGPFAPLRDARFQPARVTRLAQRTSREFLAEHRPVTALFLNSSDDLTASFVDAVADIVEDHGGFVRATEGDKGSMIFALFGAPTAMAERQLECVSAAVAMRALNPQLSIGIASGRAYTGPVGSESRWDYTALGDAVNTAARLMSVAQAGLIVADSATADAIRAHAELGTVTSLQLKGKAEPVDVVEIIAITPQRLRDHLGSWSPFAGRSGEVEAVCKALVSPGLSLVVGEAGTGKSRLLSEALSQSVEPSVTIGLAATDRTRPFALWPRLFAALFEAGPATIVDDLGLDPEIEPRLPLLNPLLQTPVAETALTQSLSPEDRLPLLVELMIDLMRQSPSGPVAIEDLHWADEASLELLAAVAPRLTNRTIVATSRPNTQIAELLALRGIRTIDLGPIGDQALTEIATTKWVEEFGNSPSDSVVADIVRRSAGSPLFCEQITAYARTSGVAPIIEQLPDDIGVPNTLAELLLVQLDALPPDAVTAASLCATYGPSFSEADLIEAFGHGYDPEEISSGLEMLRDRGFIASGDQMRFVHALFAESTYERMAFDVRSRLHLDVIQWLEQSEIDAETIPLLAFHAERSNDLERKRTYFRLVADQAAEQWASEAAMRWYGLLLPLLEGHERGQVALQVGRIETVAGDINRAERHLIDAIKDLDDDTTALAELALARVLVNQGSARAAFSLIDETIDKCRERQAWQQLHDALETKADIATMLGDVDRAHQVTELHERLVAELGPDSPVSAEVTGLIPLLWIQGDLYQAIFEYSRLYRTFEDAGDLVMAGVLASDLAGLHADLGDAEGAFTWMTNATELATKVGDARTMIRLRVGESDLRRGFDDMAGARTAALWALEASIERDDPRSIAISLWSLGPFVPLAQRHRVFCLALVLATAVADETHASLAVEGIAETYASNGDPQWLDFAHTDFASPEGGTRMLLLRMRLAMANPAEYHDVALVAVAELANHQLNLPTKLEVEAVGALLGHADVGPRFMTDLAAAYARYPARVLRICADQLDITLPELALEPLVGLDIDVSVIDLLDRVDALARPELIDWEATTEHILLRRGSGP